MMSESSNESILDQLRNGTAKFVLVSSSVRSISGSKSFTCPSKFFHGATGGRFFAKIAPPGGFSPATKKIERYSVQKVAGDGRCMFRALVKGMALNKGVRISSRQERDDADELRMAVKEVICDNDKERHKYEEAIVAITVEESLKRYCQRIRHSDFWGGESELLVCTQLGKRSLLTSFSHYTLLSSIVIRPVDIVLNYDSPLCHVMSLLASGIRNIRDIREACQVAKDVVPTLGRVGYEITSLSPGGTSVLLGSSPSSILEGYHRVLSKLCHQPIIVYIPGHEHKSGPSSCGFIPIAEYGAEFRKGSGKGNQKGVVRLLYSGSNHYDLLV